MPEVNQKQNYWKMEEKKLKRKDGRSFQNRKAKRFLLIKMKGLFSFSVFNSC